MAISSLRKWMALGGLALAGCGSGHVSSPQNDGDTAADLQLTTTLLAETANNTAASDLFVDRYTPATRFNGSTSPISNGDAAASPLHRADMARGAVSKIPMKSLLRAGSTTRLFVETQAWFCTNGANPIPTGANADQCGSHIDIGYDSNSSAQVAAQMDDMISRGVDGAIVDWQGKSAGKGIIDAHSTNVSAINSGNLFAMLAESEKRGAAFKVAAMEDEGIRSCASSSGCDVTQALIDDLNFLADKGAFGSPAYYKDGSGRPFVFFFDVDGTASRAGKSLDWSRIRAGVRGNPIFIFENGGNFTHAQAAGAFLWVPEKAKSAYVNGAEAMNDVDWFYQQAQNHPSMHAFGSLYKGFDDLVVNGWGGGQRFMGQQCGKTWLDTFGEVNALYPSGSQVEALQVMTWDDYEEGTEIESGIDNHLALSASAVNGTVLSWSLGLDGTAPTDCKAAVNGGWSIERTVHHYAVYASPSNDGQNLGVVADNIAPGTHSLDLKGKLPAGSYVLYVKAVGQPSIKNHLTNAVQYTVAGPTAAVTITSPTAGSTVSTDVHVVASATANVQISQLQIWDNGNKYFVQNGSSLDTTITLPPGSHTLTVTALDTSWQQISRSAVSYTVAAPSACTGTTLFCDDYSGSALATAYATQNGTWSRATGSYTASDANAWQRARATVTKDLGDFDATVVGTALGDSGLGLTYGVQAGGATSYAVIVHPAQFQGVYLKKLIAGSADLDLAHYTLPSSLAGQSVTLRVKRAGTSVTVWLDGAQVMQASDGATGLHGNVGLLESTTNDTAGAGARFTLFRIDSGSAPSSTPSNVVGPKGGSVDLLHFSITGDTRPGTSNSQGVTDYPTVVINRIADLAKQNGAGFMIDMGDHMNNWHNQTTAAQQLALYKQAMDRFGKSWFMTMGNHECDPAQMSWPLRCIPGGTNGTVGNFLAYLDALAGTGVDVVKGGKTVPWYSFDVQTSHGLARFIILADNAWCTEQQQWFEAQLADADLHAKYTIVAEHHPPYDGSDAKADVATIGDTLLNKGHKFALWLSGHAHGYEHRTDISGGRAVVLGTGGAPLDHTAGTTQNGFSYFHGYGMVDQQQDGTLKVTVYDTNNNPMDSWSVGPN